MHLSQIAVLIIAVSSLTGPVCAASCSDDSCSNVTQFGSASGVLEDDVTLLQVKLQQHEQQKLNGSRGDPYQTLSCSNFATPENDAGGGMGLGSRRRNVQYLDRHSVDCPSSDALSRWRLRTPNGKVNIKYRCCSIPSGLGSCNKYNTHPQSEKVHGESFGVFAFQEYLGQKIECHGNSLLQHWKMKTGDGKISFEYTCCPVKNTVLVNCNSMETNYNDGGSGNLIYLDRHDVNCPGSQAMKSWALKAKSSKRKEYKIKYTCCAVAPIATTTTTTTTTTLTGDPSLYKYVKVGVGQCLDETGKTLEAWEEGSLGWAQPEGATTFADCTEICSRNLNCGAFGFATTWCWLYGKKESPYVSANPYKYGQFECYVKELK